MHAFFVGSEVDACNFVIFGVHVKGTIMSNSLLHLNSCKGLNRNLHRKLSARPERCKGYLQVPN